MQSTNNIIVYREFKDLHKYVKEKLSLKSYDFRADSSVLLSAEKIAIIEDRSFEEVYADIQKLLPSTSIFEIKNPTPQQQIRQVFLHLFTNNDKSYAYQLKNGKYYSTKRLKDSDIVEHLLQTKTIAVNLKNRDFTANCCVIDIDNNESLV